MKKILKITNLLILIAVVTLVLGCTVVSNAEEQLRVSVFDFGGEVNDEYRNTAVNEVTRVLVEMGRFRVVERMEMERILQEQHFQMTGLVDQSSAVEIGKLLAVDVAFIGNIDELGYRWNSGSNGGYYSAEAKVTVKVIEVETGKVLHIFTLNGSGSDSNRQKAQLEAVISCFGENFSVQLREKFAVQSAVIRVQGNILYFLSGQVEGVKKGHRYQVLRQEDTFLPDIRVDINDSFTRQIGLVEVLEVTENYAKAKILWSSSRIMAGDILKEQPRIHRTLIGGGMSMMEFSVESSLGMRETGQTSFVEIRTVVERPFSSTTGLVLGVGAIKEVSIVNMGLEIQKEIPIVPGSLFLTVGGIGGLSAAVQQCTYYEWTWQQVGDASAYALYLAGTVGGKWYLTRDRGICLEIAGLGQLGPNFSSWGIYEDGDQIYDVTDDVNYRKVGLGGLGFRAMLGIQF